MVKKKKTEDITHYYICEKCRWPYTTLEAAEKCEAKEPERTYVGGPGEKWKIGDIAFVEVHCGANSGYRLVQIDHEYERHHYERPFWVPIDGLGPLPIREVGETDGDDWMDYTPMHMLTMNAHVLDEKRIQQLLTIASVLQSSAPTANEVE